MVSLTRLQRRGPGGNVKRANVATPGNKTIETIGKLGSNLANLGNSLLKERKDQQTREFRDNNYFDYLRGVQDFKRDNVGLAKTNQAEYLEKYNTFLEDGQSSIADTAPTEEARNEFLNKSNSLKGQALVQADSDLARNSMELNLITKNTQINDLGAMIRDNPDPEFADQIIGDIVLGLQEDKSIPNSETIKLQKQAVDAGRESFFSTKIAQDSMGAINEAREVLKSDNLMMPTASAGERSTIENRLNAAEARVKSRVRAELVDQATTVVRGASTGVVKEKDYTDMIEDINDSAWALKPGEANKLKSKVTEARLVDNVSTTMSLTPPAERPDLGGVVDDEMSYVSDDLAGQVNKAVLTKKLKGILAEGDNKAFSDPAQYFNERDPKLRELSGMAVAGDEGSLLAYGEYRNKMTSYYEAWGHPRQARSFISPQMEKVWGEGIKSSIDRGEIDVANALFQNMQDTMGEDIHSGLLDMRKTIPEDFAVLSEITNSDSRRNAIENHINGKEIKQLAGFESDEKQSELTQDVMKGDFFEAVALQGAQEDRGRFNSLAMAKSVSLQAMKLISGGTERDAAIEQAKVMYSGNYHTVVSDWNDKVYPPKHIEGMAINPDKVKSFMENIRQDGFNPTKHFSVDLDEGISEESMNESIRERGIWVQSPDKKGIELHVRRADGKLEQLPDTSGSIIFRPYEQIQDDAPVNIPSSWELRKKSTRENLKRVFQR